MAPSSEKTVQTVAPIDIRTDRKYEPEGAADKKEAADIKEKLADIWEIGSEKITVYMEGGEKNGHE